MSKTMLDSLREQRASLLAKMDTLLDAAQARETPGFTPEERTEFDAAETRVKDLDGDIGRAEAAEERARKAAEARATGTPEEQNPGPGPARVLSEPMIYGRGSRHSYFLDMVRAEQGRGDGDGGPTAARERLQRHAKELEVEMPRRERLREEVAAREVRSIRDVKEHHAETAFERRTNPNRTDGQGGYFVPPLWLIDQYVALPRFGRVIANSVRNLTLPQGTDSINLPKVSTGTATGVQTADAAGVTSTDMTDTTVSAPVRTIAGQQDIALQLLDQSPISFDEVIFTDLMADYNVKLDVQVVSGSGSAGQATGILNVSSINAVTYTDASPTLPEMWVPWMQSASQIESNRNLPATASFVTPAIWYWAASQLDTTNRPLLLTENTGAFNPMALQTGENPLGEGPAGRLGAGLPVFIDGNIPSNLGGGTNETRIITLRTSDLFLWEGALRSRVLSEVLSGTLQVRLQIYNYFAFMGNRLPKAISVVSGTGMIPTSGF